MKKWTIDDLLKEGYRIENARIDSVDLSMEEHGCLTLIMEIEGNGFGCVYGGYYLGRGFVDAPEECFEGSALGIESIIRIMDTVGSGTFAGMTGKYIRCATNGVGGCIKIIGNIIRDKWFDIGSFYNEATSKKE